MEKDTILDDLGSLFLFIGFFILNFNALTIYRTGLWQSQKAFGIEIPNWGYQKSVISFWKRRDQIELKVKKRIYFEWIFMALFIVSGLILLLLNAFWE